MSLLRSISIKIIAPQVSEVQRSHKNAYDNIHEILAHHIHDLRSFVLKSVMISTP